MDGNRIDKILVTRDPTRAGPLKEKKPTMHGRSLDKLGMESATDYRTLAVRELGYPPCSASTFTPAPSTVIRRGPNEHGLDDFRHPAAPC